MPDKKDPLFEVIDLGIDIDRLRDHVAEHVLRLPKVKQSEGFGGWSVLAKSGQYTDGWQKGHLLYKTGKDGSVFYDSEKALELEQPDDRDHWRPTEICFGYLGEVIQQIHKLGLGPRRARISCIPAGGSTDWHRDALDSVYCVRLHIPIITNKDCTFMTEKESVHMPADGRGYVVRVNQIHKASNAGTEDRFHLIMNIYDLVGKTKYFGYPKFKKDRAEATLG